MGPSALVEFGGVTIHAKNTTNLAGNSDVDLTVRGWNIFHVPGGPAGSTSIELGPSDYIWATSNFDPSPGNPFPSFGPSFDDPNGHWVHLDFSTVFHNNGKQGSGFYAREVKTALTIGIDHIPEPATMILLGGAGLAFLRGRRARKQLSA